MPASVEHPPIIVPPAPPRLRRDDEPGALERIERLEAVDDYEDDFDRICTLAARILHAPLSMVTLVTETQQFLPGVHGALPEPFLTERATPISHSLCQHVAASGQTLVAPDTHAHPLLRDNPSVRDLNVSAYLGIPLTTASGHTLGSLCVIDFHPHPWTADAIETMHGLAALAMVEIELRLSRSKLAALEVSRKQLDEQTRLLVHDLRTPLNSLLLGLETVPLLGEMNPDQQEALDVARRGGQTLMRLVDDLLDTSALDSRGADSLDYTAGLDALELIVAAVGQVAAMAAHGGLTLLIEPGDGADGAPRKLTFEADQDKLVRALVNLLSNAIKFTPPRGRVSVGVRQGGAGAARTVTFVVRDTGPGIAPENHGRIFERYVHLKPGDGEDGSVSRSRQRSTGLGLTFVKTVAEAHGGRVTVESAPGQGSVFSLEIPRERAR